MKSDHLGRGPPKLKLSAKCKKIAASFKKRDYTLKELIVSLGFQGGAFLSLILSLPFIFWVAFPGLSLIFGVLILCNGIQIARGKAMWFPASWGKKKLNRDKMVRLFRRAEKWFKKSEKLFKPRMQFMHKFRFFKITSGIMLAVFGFFLALPFPPGTNFPPAIAVACICIGLLEDDGLYTLLGYFFFLVNLFVFLALPILGVRYLVRWW